MSDTIPQKIHASIKAWKEWAKANQHPCQIFLSVSPQGEIVDAKQLIENRVTAK